MSNKTLAYLVSLLVETLFWNILTIFLLKSVISPPFSNPLWVVGCCNAWVDYQLRGEWSLFEQTPKKVVWGWDTSAQGFGERLWLWIEMMIVLTSTHLKFEWLNVQVHSSPILWNSSKWKTKGQIYFILVTYNIFIIFHVLY